MISSIEAISENGSVSKSWPLTSGPKTKEAKIIGSPLSRRQDGARNKDLLGWERPNHGSFGNYVAFTPFTYTWKSSKYVVFWRISMEAVAVSNFGLLVNIKSQKQSPPTSLYIHPYLELSVL